jgi:thioredoxin-related protein
LPSLENLHQYFKDEPFVILAISIQEDKDTVLKHVSDNGLSFTNLLDNDGMVSAQFGVRSTPTKILLDKEGDLTGMALGYRKWDSEEMKSLISMLISKKS